MTFPSPFGEGLTKRHHRWSWLGCVSMSADRAICLDSPAIVKLAVAEAESAALRGYLRRRRPLVSSALARTEVGRALAPFGPTAVGRGEEVLARVDLVRVSDLLLDAAARLLPAELRSLDAIHLETARRLGASLARVVTYDERMFEAARAMGWTVAAPS